MSATANIRADYAALEKVESLEFWRGVLCSELVIRDALSLSTHFKITGTYVSLLRFSVTSIYDVAEQRAVLNKLFFLRGSKRIK